MAVEYDFTLDMDTSKRDNNIAYARVGDVNSIVINADLVFEGGAYTPVGSNAYFECITPNMKSIRSSAQVTDSKVTATIPSAAFQAAGVINVAYFRFENGDEKDPTYVESTEPFAIIVRESIGNAIDEEDYIESWRQFIDQIEAAAENVQNTADAAVETINTRVEEVNKLDEQLTESVNENIAELDKATEEAVQAMEDALSGTQYGELVAKLSRVWKLDSQDMVAISQSADLNTLTDVGTYVSSTASITQSVANKPADVTVPFVMFNIKVSDSITVQLVVPSKKEAGDVKLTLYMRDYTSSVWGEWSEIGGGADITAGAGIDITGEGIKEISADKAAFYEEFKGVSIVSADTSVTNTGRLNELKVYGKTRQNLWVNPSGTSNGITVTSNDDGSMNISGDATTYAQVYANSYALKPSSTYTISIDALCGGFGVSVVCMNDSGIIEGSVFYCGRTNETVTFSTPSNMTYARMQYSADASNKLVSGTYRVMLNEGDTAEPWCPPGLNSVKPEKLVTAGKNLVDASSMTPDRAVDSNDGNIYTTQTSGNWYATETKLSCPPSGLSLVCSAEDAHASTIAFYTQSGLFISGKTISKSQRAVVPDGASLMAIDVYKDYFENFQLELGSTATDYEPPHVTETALPDVELRSVPSGASDVLRINQSGTCSVDRYCLMSVFDGSDDEEWELAINIGGIYNFKHAALQNAVYDAVTYPGSVIGNKSIVSNIFQAVETTLNENVIPSICAWNDGFYVRCTQSTVEEFKRFLNANPLVVVYRSKQTTESFGTIDVPASISSSVFNSYVVNGTEGVEAEFDEKVSKVDNLPAIYSAEQIDEKLGDIEVLPDVLPASRGGTGVTSAAAERNRLGLGNTTGALPVANGGTGLSSLSLQSTKMMSGSEFVALDTSFANIPDQYIDMNALTDPKMYNVENASMQWLSNTPTPTGSGFTLLVFDNKHDTTSIPVQVAIADDGSVYTRNLTDKVWGKVPRFYEITGLPISDGGVTTEKSPDEVIAALFKTGIVYEACFVSTIDSTVRAFIDRGIVVNGDDGVPVCTGTITYQNAGTMKQIEYSISLMDLSSTGGSSSDQHGKVQLVYFYDASTFSSFTNTKLLRLRLYCDEQMSLS